MQYANSSNQEHQCIADRLWLSLTELENSGAFLPDNAVIILTMPGRVVAGNLSP